MRWGRYERDLRIVVGDEIALTPTDGLEQLELLGTRRHTGTDTFFGTRNG